MERKEAIDIVRKNWPNGRHQLSEALETLIPELKESEDERIRKEIIGHFEKHLECSEEYGKDVLRSWITWLEKQGEQKETLCDKCRREQPSHSCQDITALGRCALEHQSKQKPTDKVEPRFKVGDWVVYETDEWREVLQIENIELGRYIFTNGSSSSFAEEKNMRLWTIRDVKDGDVITYGDNPNDHHVEVIMIFKSLRNEKSSFNHFHIFDDKFRIDDWSDCGKSAHPATKEQRDLLFAKMREAGYEWDVDKKELKKIEHKPVDKVKPKFKVGDKVNRNDREDEEYYILTIAYVDIDEHYYICDQDSVIDFEEQDLWHIVEQKPTCLLDNSVHNIKFPFKAKVKSNGKIVTIYGGQLSFDGKEWIKYQSDSEDGYKVYEPDDLELVCEIKQKPAWSEEDEEMFDAIIADIQFTQKAHNHEVNQIVYEREIDWLKSIKDRVQPQPKQEWGEEDGKTIDEAISLINMLASGYGEKVTEPITFNGVKMINNIKERLRNLHQKPNHWKPSEEQMEALRIAYEVGTANESWAMGKLKTLYNDLKAL